MAGNGNITEVTIGAGNLYVAWDTQQPARFGSPLSSTNTQALCVPLDLRGLRTSCFQVHSDGGALLRWVYQLSNIPATISASTAGILGVNTRNDAATSPHWATADSGVLLVNAAGATVHRTQPYATARNGRLVITWDPTNAASAVANVAVTGRGTPA